MEFLLVIDLDNDAFQEDPGVEITRIMERLGSRLANNPDLTSKEAIHHGTVHDVNGNRVGLWQIENSKTEIVNSKEESK
tara:strand:- start:300 stop:536 length:237 start_codon:yes stop_codon:yes gene_type:complete